MGSLQVMGEAATGRWGAVNAEADGQESVDRRGLGICRPREPGAGGEAGETQPLPLPPSPPIARARSLTDLLCRECTRRFITEPETARAAALTP